MIWLKRYWQFWGKLTGLLLILTSLIAAYWWFYKLAPLVHVADPRWVDVHSEKARWLEEQKDYKRTGRYPDLFFIGDRIGYYGDKVWFLWLVDKAAKDKFRVCGCTMTALALMSNQDTNSWVEWLKTNRTRTQEEWIQDGFSKYGVSVHFPPSTNDVEPLLKIIGGKTWNFLVGGPQGTNAPDAIPSYVQYNAFRWLRDSGFNPVSFAVSNATAVAPNNLTVALIRYSQWEGRFPPRNGLGVLSFGAKPETMPLPMILELRSLTVVYTLITVPLLAGIALVFFSCRKNHQPNQVPDSTNAV
jgi:hypothetical protein